MERRLSPRASPRADLETRRRVAQTYRLAFGMTLSAGIAFYYAWPLAFISPVLAAKLLSLPKVMPVKAGIAFVAILSAAFILSSTLLLPTLRYPLVHLLLVGLILFHLFYARAGGANPIIVVFAVIGVMAIPLVGSVSEALASGVAKGLSAGAALAVAMVYASAALFPDPAELGPTVVASGGARKTKDAKPPPPPQRVRLALALRSLVVIYPLYVAFLLFSLVDLAVVLIFAALLGLEPTFGKHWAAGKGLILANLAGGMVAVVVYNVLIWVPAYLFFLLLVALAGLVVGRLIFSETPLGKLLAGGITTVFVVLGPVLYVVVAFGIMERLTRGRRVAG
jgi:hypothetical protein